MKKLILIMLLLASCSSETQSKHFCDDRYFLDKFICEQTINHMQDGNKSDKEPGQVIIYGYRDRE